MPQPRRAMLIGPVIGSMLAALLLAAATAATAAVVPAAARSHGTSLFGVSCTSSSHCMTVGSRVTTGTRTDTLAEEWSRGAWRVLMTPNPKAARTSYLNEVSCRSAARCVAIGSSTSKAHGTAALAVAWNGSRWRLTRSAVPAGAHASELYDISCRERSACVAVGDYTAGSGVTRPFAERWNGTRWRRLTTPDVRGARSGILDGVLCRGSGCMAVGFARTSSNPLQAVGLAEAWNGHSWRVLSFPDPARALFVDVQDVSCATRSRCVAVGFSDSSGQLPKSLAELWQAGKWHRLKAPAKAPAGVILEGVSCPARTACVAVGLRPTGTAAGDALAAQAWNGTRWRTLKTAYPTLTTASFLNQVSCPFGGRCLAVGSQGSGKHVSALAEIWNGARWKVLKIPSP
jgi:hypothetical protein